MTDSSLDDFLSELDDYRKTQKLPESYQSQKSQDELELKYQLIATNAEKEYFEETCYRYQQVCTQLTQLLQYQQKTLALSRRKVQIFAHSLSGFVFSIPLTTFNWQIKLYNNSGELLGLLSNQNIQTSVNSKSPVDPKVSDDSQSRTDSQAPSDLKSRIDLQVPTNPKYYSILGNFILLSDIGMIRIDLDRSDLLARIFYN